MWFTQVSLRNPVFATMVMVAFVVLGIFSFQRLQVDQFPNIDFPVVVVTTAYPGASPEIVESEVTKKVEEAVNAVAGVNTLTSRSFEGSSVVIIEFQLTIDGRKAAEDVREKIGILRPLLRDEVEEPRVLRFDPAARSIWSVAVIPEAVNGKAPSAVELTTWAEQTFKKRLENVRGVGSVTLVGGTQRAINIELNPSAMEALGVTTEQVTTAVRNENQDLPVGTLKTGESERVVQVLSRLQNPQDFGDIIVARRAGQAVRLSQVATVNDGTEEVQSLALYNGQRTLLLQVQKSQDENTIAVTDGLKAAVETLRAELPPGIRLEQIADGSRPIRVSVDNVRRTLIEGALLTVLIVFLFLNSWRSTVITGLTLPIALIGTFFFMNLFGFTINMITLMALTLSVGLLIDDAIVVRENIVRHVQMGKTPYNAAMEGTQEIGMAVLATTLSIVAVFLPIGFMGGIIGKFFHEFGITMVAAVLISMFVSFTLDPMLSSVWHDPEIEKHGKGVAPRTLYDKTIGRVTGWFDRFQDDLADTYQTTLRWSLKHKLATLGVALATFIGSLFVLPLLGTEFVPKADFSETSLSFHTPVGSSLQATEAKTREVEAILRQFPEVKYTLSTLNTGIAQGTMYASVYVRLVDRKDRTLSADAMSAQLRERLRSVPGITVTHVGLLDAVGGNKQVEFSLQGDDLAELERLTATVLESIRPIVGLVDLDASVKPNKPTVDVKMRRELASDAGMNVAAVGSALRTLVAGTTVGNWRAQNGESYDVNVQLAATGRERASDLEQLPFMVGTATDGTARVVRLGQVAEVVASTGPNQINRRNLNREVSINANVFGRSAGEVSTEIRQVLDSTPFPPGYRYEFGGSTKNMQESFGYAISALALAIIFIYMILASQFESFLQPLALMTALPLTLIGVALSLLMFGSTMSMFSVIGLVVLMGLVTKIAVVLVDFAIGARHGLAGEAPMDRESALLLAARVRLRPILMTTLAMVFGMVPLAFALTEGSEQRAPMGQAVIGGVITSSLLTLVVVPVVYCYMDDLAQWFRRKLGMGPAAAEPAAAAP
ncbi:MAG: efflux RND transporter permease subunit [Hydrogenophaga sp.]|nr:efflux RND transporter permease subunit [Hydrogenophaga sp.]